MRGGTLRIMTLNLRFDNPDDGDNGWPFRRDAAVKTIGKHSPHLLGTQEGLPHQIEYLISELKDYEVFAPGRVFEEGVQLPTIFYLKDEIEPLEGGEFWLSESPGVPMSKSWGAAWPRLAAYGRFMRNHAKFTFLVTHLDNVSSLARMESARAIGSFLKDRSGPQVVAGDMNEPAGLGVHRVFTKGALSLVDPWDALGLARGRESYTYHGFTGRPECGRIDWILLSPHFKPRFCFVVREPVGGRFPSDHFPVVADVELAGDD